MAKTRTRLKDVAESLNLSTALISGVLNGRQNVWASEETRARILKAVAELNYQPSTAARALSHGKTHNVALVYRRLPSLDYGLAYTGLVDVFSAALQPRGHNLVVSNFATEDDVLDHLQRLAGSRSCDAVILWGREADTEPQGELLQSLGIPFIVKGRHEEKHPDWLQLDFDHEWMMERAVEQVVSLGHRRLAYLGFPHNEAFVHSLRHGFERAHRRLLGTDPDPSMMGEFQDLVAPNEERIEQWLSLPADRRPTAFVMGAGNFAWQALETSLARIGRSLGFGPDNYAAAGIASYWFTLMFGEAIAYQGIEIDNLARSACPGLLETLLTGHGSETIVRFRPEMSAAPSLQLLRHGVAFVHPESKDAL